MDFMNKGIIKLAKNGDHAVTWRLLYNLKFEHEVINARNAVNLEAFKLQSGHGIKLATPLTHTLHENKRTTAQ